MRARLLATALAKLALLLSVSSGWAEAPLPGAQMAWPWSLPFLGMLATIAVGPLLFRRIWHRHYGKLAALWSSITVLAIAWFVSPVAALETLLDVLLAQYLSFIVVLFALFTVAGGILVTGTLRGTPLNNTGMLALGTAIAPLVGTTGAAMILIRPLIRANQARPHHAHVIVFFILLAANIGGALTPFGDPPLFVGFLHGVDFFWTAQHLWRQTGVVAGLVLALFFGVDLCCFRMEGGALNPARAVRPAPIRVHGLVNVALIAAIVAVIAGAAIWRPAISVALRGVRLEPHNMIRDAVLVAIALISLKLTPEEHREANGFSFEPIREVAILFAGIFVCISPVVAMLQAGKAGSFAWLLNLVTGPRGPSEVAYFWTTGGLSAFLDNAPTYLVFFELAGGDAKRLMGPLAGTLVAISMGAVYMGALTYIGNAPNLMIYAIAVERGIKMPSFFSYMLWASLALLPVFIVLTVVFLAER